MANYVLVVNDRAEADRDRLYLSRLRRDPDYAKIWDDGLTAALDDLCEFPGPLSHAKDEAASALFGREVRRLLYYGPTRRRTGIPSRILFTLLSPAPMSRLKLRRQSFSCFA